MNFTDARGNVDRDSDEEVQPEAYAPDYESLPALRPAQPPQYRPTPNYPHGGIDCMTTPTTSCHAFTSPSFLPLFTPPSLSLSSASSLSFFSLPLPSPPPPPSLPSLSLSSLLPLSSFPPPSLSFFSLPPPLSSFSSLSSFPPPSLSSLSPFPSPSLLSSNGRRHGDDEGPPSRY